MRYLNKYNILTFGARMKHLKFIPILAVILSCFNAFSAEIKPVSISYEDFLVNNKIIEIVVEKGKAKIFPGGHDEKYWARDTSGNFYKLRLKNALPNYAEIGASVLIDLIGAPNQAVCPILLKRGTQFLPSATEAKKLAPQNDKMGLAGSRGEWFQATIQKVVQLQKLDANLLTAKQLAGLSIQLIANFIVGNNDNALGNGSDGNLGFDGTHFYTLDATQSFKSFADEGKPSLEPAFYQARHLFSQAMNHLNSDQVSAFMLELNNYLTRLEKIEKTDLEPVLGHYFIGINSLRKFRGGLEFDYWQELLRRAKEARQGTINFLATLGMDTVLLATLKTPSQAIKAPVALPLLSLAQMPIPSAHKHSASDLTWALYFESFWKKRNEALASWAKELQIPEESVIPTLQSRKK